LKRSLKDVVRGGFIILENHPIGHKITTDPTVLSLTFLHALSLKGCTQGFEVKMMVRFWSLILAIALHRTLAGKAHKEADNELIMNLNE
jgi:hypothetical protein